MTFAFFSNGSSSNVRWQGHYWFPGRLRLPVFPAKKHRAQFRASSHGHRARWKRRIVVSARCFVSSHAWRITLSFLFSCISGVDCVGRHVETGDNDINLNPTGKVAVNVNTTAGLFQRPTANIVMWMVFRIWLNFAWC